VQQRDHWRLLLLSLTVLIAACASPPQSAARPADGATIAESKPSRVLSVIMRTEPYNLTASASARNRITVALFTASLANLEHERPVSVLAAVLPQLGSETWQVYPEGGMQTTYRLRPGLSWHDGSPLRADDFVFAHDATQAHMDWALSSRAFNLAEHRAIRDISAPDDQTLVIRWGELYPDAATPAILAFPRHVLGPSAEQGNEAFGSDPYWTTQYVGLGPYRLSAWEPGAFLQGTAFDGYALGRPKIDSVKVTWSADQNATLSRLLAGDADIAADDAVGYPQATILRARWGSDGSGVVLLSPSSMRHIQVQFRPSIVNPAAVLDLRVRKAIAYSLDRQAIVDALVDGLGIPTDNIGLPTSVYYPQVQQVATKYSYDPRLVEQSLVEAGFTQGGDGFWQTSTGRFSPQVLGIAEGQEGQETTIVVDMLRRSGIEAQLNLVSGALLQRDDEMKSTFPALRTNYITPEDGIIARLVSAEVSGPDNKWGASNKAGYASTEHDQLYEQWRRTLDINDRNQLMVQLIKFYTEQLPVVPTYIDVGVIPHTAVLQGPEPVTQDTTPYSNVYLWTWKR
jgi:peptide/nickel transport system substrate-binding protein